MMPLWIKTGPTPGVTSWNQRNKDVEFICGENDSGERSRAIMALLFSVHFTVPHDFLTLYNTIPTFNNPEKEGLENIVAKRENAGYQHLLLFPILIYPCTDKFQFFSHIYFVVSKCFQF